MNMNCARAKSSAFLFFLPFVFAAAASAEIVRFEEPSQERRYQTLIKELRCLVCQNQTLAESKAELAADMRAIVAEMVRDGESDDKVAAFMTARYGDFVRYRPPLKLKTLALWLAPFALVLFLLFLIMPKFFRRRARAKDDPRPQKAAKILEEKE
ncbi:MAG: cytochrome c-type biogenesis protein [Gammaproteobacteria bacterium]